MTNWIDRTIEEVTAAVDRVMGKYVPGQGQTAPSEDGHLQAEIKVISGLYEEPDDTRF
jgi:hypothetical protein